MIWPFLRLSNYVRAVRSWQSTRPNAIERFQSADEMPAALEAVSARDLPDVSELDLPLFPELDLPVFPELDLSETNTPAVSASRKENAVCCRWVFPVS